MTWLVYSLIVISSGASSASSRNWAQTMTPDSLMVWTTIGYVVLLPFLFTGSHLTTLPPMAIVVGLLAGFANGLGAWFLLIALNKGATAWSGCPIHSSLPSADYRSCSHVPR